MSFSALIIQYLDTQNVGTSRHGTATIEELAEALKTSEETVWESLAVLMLRKEVFLRGILKKRILVIRTNSGRR